MQVSEDQAQAVLAAVKTQFRRYLEPVVVDGKDYGPSCPDPTLMMDYDGHPAILWEMGPEEWAYLVPYGGTSEEERVLAGQASAEFGVAIKAPGVKPAVMPAGVYVEPIMSFILGIYWNGE